MLQLLLIDGDDRRAARLQRALKKDFSLVIVPDEKKADLILSDAGFDAILTCGKACDALPRLVGRGALLLALDGPAPEGVYAIPREDEAELAAAARHVSVTRALLSGLVREKDALKRRLEDMALQNRAKALLCRNLGFTEDQAHKYLEKQAMTLRITKTEAAHRIVATYEN